jgi:uncharacterized protein
MSMRFSGRTKELGHIRSVLDRRESQWVRVTGIRGGGKSTLVEKVMEDCDGLMHSCPPLPSAAQFTFLRASIDELRAQKGLSPGSASAQDDWHGLFASLTELAEREGRPFVLVLDDAHRLSEARSRYEDALRESVSEAAAVGSVVHVVLVGQEAGIPTGDLLAPLPAETIKISPLPFRVAAEHLPGVSAQDRVRAYSIFGGIPRVLSMLDPTVTVGTNVRRVILHPSSPLADAGASWLERDVQTPARYFAIMSALASGESDWAAVHDGIPDLTKSGQVAPYLNRLAELGLVSARRPLDAKPGSRSTRYGITDPFLAFWFRFVLPFRYAPGVESESEYYTRLVRPELEAHVNSVFPSICRQHMTYDAIETMGASARESGSLWGAGVDLPVAGILTSGAAYYGSCQWAPPTRTDAPLDRLERNMRETRYGFGRQRRIRIIFSGTSAPRWLQRDVARHSDAQLINASALVGA